MPIYIAIALVGLFLSGFIIMLSMRKIIKIIINSIIGIIVLFLYNVALSGLTGIYIGINIVTVLVVAILGVPGFFLLLVLNLIL
ncbi:pro-sigmaK processing inhibitor BofA family protein [Anaeromonas gelatinilytica]|uniref:pro-sigmaK processing inhibitor BofA family protein n=1 Tax=Anaeromonas gelatinilytica TaxID=2683194 RepID=UPI0020788EF9|nr:pro-sigmaK processing inhibitor BofA family protein [Anaeromonas gelatinilytica]